MYETRVYPVRLSPPQFNGDVWPEDGVQHRRSARPPLPDVRHGNVSLIPLRGSENEMRNSVAAFSQDPLAVSVSTNHQGLINATPGR